jgi:predicted metal-dependent hydrolase
MKLTKSILKQIIKEEHKKIQTEGFFGPSAEKRREKEYKGKWETRPGRAGHIMTDDGFISLEERETNTKLTKEQLAQVVREELKDLLSEYNWKTGDKVKHDKFGIGKVDIARKKEKTVHVIWDNPPEGEPKSGSYSRGELTPV